MLWVLDGKSSLDSAAYATGRGDLSRTVVRRDCAPGCLAASTGLIRIFIVFRESGRDR